MSIAVGSLLMLSDVPTALKTSCQGRKKATTVIISVDYRRLQKILAEPQIIRVIAVNQDEVFGTSQSLVISSNILMKRFWKQ